MPYRLRNGIYAHPFEMIACISTFLAVYSAFKLLVTQRDVLRRLDEGILSMPFGILWTWAIMGFVGCVLTAVGLTMSIYSHRGRTIEGTGLWLMGSMWLSAGVASMALDLWNWVEYIRFWAIAIGCIMRLMVLGRFQAIMRKIPEAN